MDQTCPICRGEVANRARPDWCRHEFCFVCISLWCKEHNTCPVCRGQIDEVCYDFTPERNYKRLPIFLLAVVPNIEDVIFFLGNELEKILKNRFILRRTAEFYNVTIGNLRNEIAEKTDDGKVRRIQEKIDSYQDKLNRVFEFMGELEAIHNEMANYNHTNLREFTERSDEILHREEFSWGCRWDCEESYVYHFDIRTRVHYLTRHEGRNIVDTSGFETNDSEISDIIHSRVMMAVEDGSTTSEIPGGANWRNPKENRTGLSDLFEEYVCSDVSVRVFLFSADLNFIEMSFEREDNNHASQEIVPHEMPSIEGREEGNEGDSSTTQSDE